MSPDEAIAIARTQVPPEDADGVLWASPQERDGSLIWVISEAAIGSVWIVEIDDESGAVLGVRRAGVR